MAVFDVVFEGGGAKGSAFVGALTALEAGHHITRRLIGTSAGAITATLRLVQSGVTPSGTLQDIMTAVSVPANTVLVMDFSANGYGGMSVGSGDVLNALASANTSMNITINYRQEQ